MQNSPNYQRSPPPPVGFRPEFQPTGSGGGPPSQGIKSATSSNPPRSNSPGSPRPVTQQPSPGGQRPAGSWSWRMSSPSSHCPPGLECLLNVGQLFVHQEVELLEVLTGFETKNKYTIWSAGNQQLFYAVEQSCCCVRCFGGKKRKFGMKILDNNQREVIHLDRPLRCDTCWWPCCLQKMEVFAPPGVLVGSIKQNWSICFPRYSIRNAAGDTVLRIKGPICTCGLYKNVDFDVLSPDGNTVVGRISKHWSGILKEVFTDADNFGISFPVDLDVRMKAVMLGACLLIDYMFFEQTPSHETDGPGMLG